MDLGSDVAFSVSRILSYSVIFLSVCMKFPQIGAVFSSKSSAGISLRSYWLGFSAYLVGFFYGYTNNYHISIYAETGFLGLQDTAIILLVMTYSKKWTLENFIYISITIVFIVSSLVGVVPQFLFQFLLSAAMVTSIMSKVGQIVSVYKLKAQGDVSIVTWGLAAYGCTARVYTIFVEVEDFQILINFFVAAVLNGMVVLLCLYYGKGSVKPQKQH